MRKGKLSPEKNKLNASNTVDSKISTDSDTSQVACGFSSCWQLSALLLRLHKSEGYFRACRPQRKMAFREDVAFLC